MKKTKVSIFNGILSLILCAVLLTTTILLVFLNTKNQDMSVPTRTITISNASGRSREIFDEYHNASLQESGSVLTFSGSKPLETEKLDSVDVIALEDIFGQEALDITYSLSYDQAGGGVLLTVSFTGADGTVYSDTVNGIATTNAHGESDMFLILEDEVVLLSDIMDNGKLDEINWFSDAWNKVKQAFKTVFRAVEIVCTSNPLKVIMSIVSPSVLLLGGVVECVVIPFTDSQRTENYNHNSTIKDLRLVTEGDKNGYIDDQNLYSRWKFASNTLSYNGCGVIATFNALKFSGKIAGNATEMAQLIHNYEGSASALVNGVLGLNPLAVTPMLRSYGANVKTYSGIVGQAAFELDCGRLASNQIAILCFYYFTSDMVPQAHNFCIFKNASGKYVTLNLHKFSFYDAASFLRNYAKPLHRDIGEKGFIQGWIVTR